MQDLQNKLSAKQAAYSSVSSTAGVGAAGAATLSFAARDTLLAAGSTGRGVAAGAGRLAAAAASVTVLVNVVLLGFSLYDIIDGSLQIHRDSKSPAGAIVRKLADELDDLIADVDDGLLSEEVDCDLLIEGGMQMDLY
jgi:hypothetical protein